MGLYDKFSTDADAEKDGIWLDYGDGERIKIRRAGGKNLAYKRAIERLSRDKKFQLQTDSLSDDESRELMIEVYAKSVILDWKGIKGEDGKDMPFNVENAKKLLTDLPDLFVSIMEQAKNIEWFRKKVDEADAKN